MVPEIDIPGHCRACIEALPKLLRDPGDTSQYQSVQFFDDNVLNPGLPGTYAFLDAVLDEVCALFPGPYVHMGGDEVPAGAWTGSPACARLMASEGYSNTHNSKQMYCVSNHNEDACRYCNAIGGRDFLTLAF